MEVLGPGIEPEPQHQPKLPDPQLTPPQENSKCISLDTNGKDGGYYLFFLHSLPISEELKCVSAIWMPLLLGS